MEEKKYRKPYVREVKSNWWMKRRSYIWYMIRESTALFNLWVCIELTMIVIEAALLQDAQTRISSLLSNPWVIALNIVSLFAASYHIYTWYKIFPKGVRIFTSKDPANTRLVPEWALSGSLYIVTIVASVLIVCALTFA